MENNKSKPNISDTLPYCIGCEEKVLNLEDWYGVYLCIDCNNRYDNKTGYCSLDCCLGYGCDESC